MNGMRGKVAVTWYEERIRYDTTTSTPRTPPEVITTTPNPWNPNRNELSDWLEASAVRETVVDEGKGGKSTVSAILKDCGCFCLDCDKLGHRVYISPSISPG